MQLFDPFRVSLVSLCLARFLVFVILLINFFSSFLDFLSGSLDS